MSLGFGICAHLSWPVSSPDVLFLDGEDTIHVRGQLADVTMSSQLA